MKNTKKSLTKAILVALSLGAVNNVMALEKGDWFMHVRAINVSPNDDSGLLNVGGNDLAGTGVSVNSGNSLDISVSYMLTDNWALSLLANLSSAHDVRVSGLPAELNVPNGTKVLDADVLPPTFFAQYHFNPKAKIRPYVGIGVNFTTFFNEDLTPAARSALGASNLDLDSSFGLAGQLGVDFAMKNDWFFNVDVKYIQIDTEATFNTALGPLAVDVDINPWVFGVGFGKTF